MKRLWLIQAAANALLSWCAFAWLGIRDSRASQLLETVIFGLLIVVPWLWLQNATLAYCGDRSPGLGGVFRKSGKTVLIFSGVVIVFVLLVWALGRLEEPLTTLGQRTASWLTFHLRKPIKPVTWAKAYLAVLWGVRWIALPVLLLPVAAGVATNGVRGIRRSAGKVFWVQYLLAFVIGAYIPGLLMGWVPRLTGTTAQVLSFILRFGLAYILVITTWLMLAFFSAQRAVDFSVPSRNEPAV